MNLFVLEENHWDFKTQAQQYIDSHVSKICLEIVQMLAGAYHGWGLPVCLNKQGKPYGKGYIHHPVQKWISTNDATAAFAFEFLYALLDEFRYRNGKSHDAERCAEELIINYDRVPNGYAPPYVAACGKVINPLDLPVHEKYRLHYIWDKRTFMVWTKRDPAPWLKETFYKESTQQMLKYSPIAENRLVWKREPPTWAYHDLEVFERDFISKL